MRKREIIPFKYRLERALGMFSKVDVRYESTSRP